MGVPRQEFFINQIRRLLSNTVAIGIGGSLDVISGNLPRAPSFMQRFGLEWLFRLLKEPSRFSRMKRIPEFVIEVIRSKWNTPWILFSKFGNNLTKTILSLKTIPNTQEGIQSILVLFWQFFFRVPASIGVNFTTRSHCENLVELNLGSMPRSSEYKRDILQHKIMSLVVLSFNGWNYQKIDMID